VVSAGKQRPGHRNPKVIKKTKRFFTSAVYQFFVCFAQGECKKSVNRGRAYFGRGMNPFFALSNVPLGHACLPLVMRLRFDNKMRIIPDHAYASNTLDHRAAKSLRGHRCRGLYLFGVLVFYEGLQERFTHGSYCSLQR
jgi:hypothetical protein